MKLHLNGKTAIVTGGSAGIGFAIAQALYEEGANVVLVARDGARLEQAVAALERSADAEQAKRVIAVSGDLRDKETAARIVDAAVRQFGHIDLLVNNAGAARSGSFLELKEQDFLDAWEVKLHGYIRLVQSAVPELAKRGGGSIVNIAGSAARTPSPLFVTGGTANAAIVNFTRGISKELAKSRIRINVVSPGVTATERAERLIAQRAEAKQITVEEERSRTIGEIPLGRLVEPEDIAAITLFLLSDRAKAVTGAEFVVDGGAQPGL